MKFKFILPSLTEAGTPWFRPIKYSLFPPLGLATLAAMLDPEDDAVLEDYHVMKPNLSDSPDVVVIQVYITNAHRAYRLADHYRSLGAHVCLGGLHVTSLPDEAAAHADTIFLGPGDDTWREFLHDLKTGKPAVRYAAPARRSLDAVPTPRRDLIRRGLYLVPNSLVVTRGCPHHCDFCYKDAFFRGGNGFYTRRVDAALREIESLPGRHLYFLDDHLLGHERFARELFAGMEGMGRVFQAAGTVASVLRPGLIEAAARAGLRSLFVGFENLDENNLRDHGKVQNLGRHYNAAVRRLHDHGIMVNGSFVFGMDEDGPDVFDRTVDWAVEQGVETATFHIMTPYPGTALYQRMKEAGRILHSDWERYDTRHTVFRPRHISADGLERGYHRAYRRFYQWRNLFRGAAAHTSVADGIRHFAYAAAWKKAEGLWRVLIRANQVTRALPLLERVLATGCKASPTTAEAGRGALGWTTKP